MRLGELIAALVPSGFRDRSANAAKSEVSRLSYSNSDLKIKAYRPDSIVKLLQS
jgi:hypothetical protein